MNVAIFEQQDIFNFNTWLFLNTSNHMFKILYNILTILKNPFFLLFFIVLFAFFIVLGVVKSLSYDPITRNKDINIPKLFFNKILESAITTFLVIFSIYVLISSQEVSTNFYKSLKDYIRKDMNQTIIVKNISFYQFLFINDNVALYKIKNKKAKELMRIQIEKNFLNDNKITYMEYNYLSYLSKILSNIKEKKEIKK